MRFQLVDRIVELEPGDRIVTIKALTRSEEYLADHFPRFPVMPGVLMLEAMVQAAAWLLRATDELTPSIVTLSQLQNLRLRSFVAPGEVLTVAARLLRRGVDTADFAASGKVGDRAAADGRFTLFEQGVADARPEMASHLNAIRAQLHAELNTLSGAKELVGA